jgi:hypothetical protein
VSVDIIAPLTGDTVPSTFFVTISYDVPGGPYQLDCTVAGATQSTSASNSGSWTTGGYTPGSGSQTVYASIAATSDTDSEDVTVSGNPPIIIDFPLPPPPPPPPVAANGTKTVTGKYDASLGGTAIVCEVMQVRQKKHPRPFSMRTITPLAGGTWAVPMPVPPGLAKNFAIRVMLTDAAGNVLGSNTVPLK